MFCLSVLGGLIAFDENLRDCLGISECGKKDDKGKKVDRKHLINMSSLIAGTIMFSVFLIVRIIISVAGKANVAIRGAGGNAIVAVVTFIVALFMYVFYSASITGKCFESCVGK